MRAGGRLIASHALSAALLAAPTFGVAQDLPRLSYRAEVVAPVPGEDAGFSPMNVLEVGPDGRLYVSHPFEGRIRVFDRNGAPAGEIPAERGGPPLRADRIGWTGDTLYVVDGSRATVIWFDARGRRIRSAGFRLPALDRSVRATTPARVLPGGRVLIAPFGRNGAIASGALRRIPVVTARLDGRDVDTVATRSPGRALMAVQAGPLTTVAPQPFNDDALVAIPATGDHIVVVERSVERSGARPAFAVHKLDLGGDTTWSRRFPYTARTLAPEWVDGIVAARLEAMMSGDAAPARADTLRRAVRAALHVPPWLPPVVRVFVGRNDRIWLRREEVPGAETGRWEVLSPAGERVGFVEVPAGWSIRAADRTTAWATESVGERRYRIWRLVFTGS